MARISLNYPDTGLTVSISVYNRDTGSLSFSGTMTEVEGVYKYDFTELVNTDYVYVATVTGYDDMRGVIYRDGGGLTTVESDRLMGIVGGGGVSSQAVQSMIEKAKKEIIEKVDEIPQTDLTEINDKLDTIDIAKEQIINIVKETEKEVCNDIKTINKELKEDNVATRQLVRQKAKKLDENVSKLAGRQQMVDEAIEAQADSIEDELEGIYSMECDIIEKDMEDIFNKEADSIEEIINTSK